MSEAPTYQSESYECSIQNSSVRISNAEWINDFSDGIKLSKGDNVRLLGSFVHEGSSGEEIQINQDMNANVSFSTFIKANTYGTLDKTANLINLGDIGDLAYSTDNFGIEPPLWYTDQTIQDVQLVAHSQNNKDQTQFSDPIATAYQPNYDFNSHTNNGPGFFGAIPWFSDTNKAITWGTNIRTDIYGKPGPGFDAIPGMDYSNFSNASVENEMYMSQMVKKIILPVFTHFRNCNRSVANLAGNAPTVTNFDERQMEDCILNPPDSGPGCFSGIPKPGMCIATVDIGGSSGWEDEDGKMWFEATWGSNNGGQDWNGYPNTKGGVQSVVGTILATRFIKMNIMGQVQDVVECMVGDFVNPAQIHTKPIGVAFPPGQLYSGSATHQTFASRTLNTANVVGYKKVHGGGDLPNGYSVNPSQNLINGSGIVLNNDQSNQQGNGCCTGMFSRTPSNIWNVLDYSGTFANGADRPATDISPAQKLFATPTGLSFLWNGSHCGQLRYGCDRIDTTNEAMASWIRANTKLFWERPTANKLCATACINEFGVQADAANTKTFQRNLGSGNVPVCFGAYVITTPECMKNLVAGNISTSNVNNWLSGTAGRATRIWFDYAFQANKSGYNLRHGQSNSWNVTSQKPRQLPQTGWTQYPGEGLGGSGSGAGPFENRFTYEFCGQPLNINWRDSQFGQLGGTGVFRPDGGRVLAFPDNTNQYPQSHGSPSNNDATQIGEFMPTYHSTPTGKLDPAAAAHPLEGAPFVYGGYNTTINSIYFQDKYAGDVNLGINTSKHILVLAVGAALGAGNIVFSMLDKFGNPFTHPVPGDLIHIPFDNATIHNFSIVNAFTVNGDGDGVITFDPRFVLNHGLLVGQEIVYYSGGGPVSAGLRAEPWEGDCIMIREQMTKIKVPAGYYTETDLGSLIDEQLHATPAKYAHELGTRNADGTYNIPTTVGLSQKSRASQPSIVNGNYLHSVLPDINFGFTPVTTSNGPELGLTPSTIDMTSTFLTYDPIETAPGSGVFQYDFAHNLPTSRPYDGITVRKWTDSSDAVLSTTGKHIKLYSVPYVGSSPKFNSQIHLIRLKGGALNYADFNTTEIPNRWDCLKSRFAGMGESLRDFLGITNPTGHRFDYGCRSVKLWKTRLTRNLFSMGGSARVFLGANNFTFEWNPEVDRFSFNNLYTPLRPHNKPSGVKSDDFGIDDAVPSAIISCRDTGDKIGALSGIYLNNLNSDSFTQQNWGSSWYNKWLYDTISDTQQQEVGQLMMDALGYSSDQVAKFVNSFNLINNPFIYLSDTVNTADASDSGTAIRVGPLIDTAVNGTNPFASYCSLIAPVQQFYVEVATDDFFGENTPIKGIDPYYFIASDFPGKRFYGNDVGQRLPVIGICARNFHSFNFAFDLGSSAINFTVEEDITITSIRTAIMTSNLKPAENLSKYSSIIYLVTRNNFINNIPQQLLPNVEKLLEQARQPQPDMGYYKQPEQNYRSEPPAILPPHYNKPDGTLVEYDSSDEEY